MEAVPVTQEPVPDRLRAAALELFASKGFGPVSIREIADRAGFTSAVLYHYYASKEHLYQAILEDRIVALHGRLALANDLSLEPDARIEAVCRAFLEHFRDEGTGGRFVLRELLGLGAEKFKTMVESRDAQTRSYFRHALLEGMETGLFLRVDSTMCSMSISAIVNSFARRWALGATFSLEDALAQITKSYLRGLRTTPDGTNLAMGD